MRIVLTAGTSFIGGHLFQRLTNAGHEVIATCRKHRSKTGRHERLHPHSRFVQVDLADADGISAQLPDKVDFIVHTAGVSAGPQVTRTEMIRCNVLGTENLLDYALRTSARGIIHTSTLSIYGRIDGTRVDETTPSIEPDIYGASKLLGERMMADLSERLPVLALRLPGTLGRGAHRAWIPTLVDRLKSNLPVTIFNPDAAFNNAAHVDDVGSLILGTLERDWRGFHALPIGAAGSTTIGMVVETLKQALGSDSEIVVRSNDKQSFTISSVAAMKHFGYSPMDIVDMLKRYATETTLEDE